jgi:hypothetical protein
MPECRYGNVYLNKMNLLKITPAKNGKVCLKIKRELFFLSPFIVRTLINGLALSQSLSVSLQPNKAREVFGGWGLVNNPELRSQILHRSISDKPLRGKRRHLGRLLYCKN